MKPLEKVVYPRYEHARPGDLIHVDIKKLRGFLAPGHARTGDRSKRSRKQPWVYLHNHVDDATRLAYSSIQPDETAESALRAFEEARAFFEAHGITIRRVLTDNGSCYKKKWRTRMDELHITAKHTRPYTPRTNGKVERFNRTMLAEWAYADTYENSRNRNAMLPAFLQRYNHHRPHRGLKGITPIQALAAKLAPAA
jgi:transposase InsO family protein